MIPGDVATSVSTEVVRVATPTTLQTVTLVVGAVAGALALVLVARGLRPVPAGADDRSWWTVTVIASVAQLALLAAGPMAGPGDHRVLALVGRLGLLVGAAVLPYLDVRVPVAARAGHGVVVGLTVPLATSTAGIAARAPVVWGVPVAALLVAWWVVGRWPSLGPRLVLTAVTAGALALASAPGPGPAVHTARLGVADVSLDVTVVPDARELHVYVRDGAGAPAAMDRMTVRLAPYGAPQPLFEVSADHHLSLTFELPAERPLDLEFSGVRSGRRVEVRWTLEEP